MSSEYFLIKQLNQYDREHITRLSRHAEYRNAILKAKRDVRRQQFTLWWSQIRRVRIMIQSPAADAVSQHQAQVKPLI